MQAIWIEIPVRDLDRAKQFYETVFGHAPTDVIDDGERKITIIPGAPTVSLNQTAGFIPGEQGALPYFGRGDELDATLERVIAAGGEIVDAKTARGENGFFSLVRDPEGNLLTLHGTS